jgi:hypothetical protein
MARWIEDPCGPVAPELILRRDEDVCAHGDCTIDGLIHVGYVHEYNYGRTPVTAGHAAGDHIRELGLDYEERPVDAHRDMDWRAIRTWSTHLLDCAKRCRAEVHLRLGTLADQHGEYSLHALWDRFDRRHRLASRLPTHQAA